MFETEEEATQEAGLALSLMKGKGWKIQVWHNLGWCFAIYNGPVSIYPSMSQDGKVEYWAQISDEIPEDGTRAIGSPAFWTPSKTGYFYDPNAAVVDALMNAEYFVSDCQDVIDFVRKAMKE